MLGDPVRRRILELLATDELPAGAIAERIGDEFGISQPAVSQHLRVLRDSGFATVRAEGTRRLYAIEPTSFDGVEDWLATLRGFWEQRLDALGTELARGARARRRAVTDDAAARSTGATRPSATAPRTPATRPTTTKGRTT